MRLLVHLFLSAILLMIAGSLEQAAQAQELTVKRISLHGAPLPHLTSGKLVTEGRAAGADGKQSLFQTLRDLYPDIGPNPFVNAPSLPKGSRSARPLERPGFFLVFDPSLPVETNGEAVEHAVGHLINTDAFIDAVVIVPGPDTLANGSIEVLRNLGNGPGGWLGLTTHVVLTVGREPTGVAVADLDGDGNDDIAVTNAGDGNVMIFLNDALGLGNFGPAPSLICPIVTEAGERPLCIAAVDFSPFSGSTGVDLAVGNGVTNTVTILTNNPVPPFQQAVAFTRTQDISVGIAPVEVCPINTDNDKDLDLAIANSGSNTVSVLMNQPTLALGPGAPFNPILTLTLNVGEIPLDLSAGLIDGDLFPDIVSSNADGTLTIILNNGATFDNSLPDIPLGLFARSVDIGDFDNDGNLDLAVVALAPSTDPYLIPQKTRSSSGKLWEDIAGDNTVFARTVLLLENLGSVSGTVDLADPLKFSVPGEPNFVVNADFNNDGIIDFSTSNRDPFGPGGGAFTVEVIPPGVFLPPTGACCLSNGSCVDGVTSVACSGLGGTYLGNDSICAGSNCLGACCISDGSCFDFSPDLCSAFGGLFQGLGTTCATVTCIPFGACCLKDGTCVPQITVASCAALGGFYNGDGTTCPNSTCSSCSPGGLPPGNDAYDITNTVGVAGGVGFFLINDPSFPGAPDDIVDFDGVPEAIATYFNGVVPTLTEIDIAGVGATHTITIDCSSPPGTDLFPGGLTSGGFPLTDGAIFLGQGVSFPVGEPGDRVDTDAGSIIDFATLEFFTNGVSVSGPFDVSGLIVDADGVWDGTTGITISNLAGLGANNWILIVQITEDPAGCPPGPCPSDIVPPGGDGITNIDDLVMVLATCGTFGPPRPLGDVVPACGDWVVNLNDIIFVMNNFGPCPVAPGNACADAILAVSGPNPFNSAGFSETLAPGVNQCEFANPQLDDIWFRFTASVTGSATADLCGSIPDLAMSVFPDDCALTSDPLSALGCGDDNATACPGSFQPEVNWFVTAGQSYLIVISGFSGGGAGTLNLSENPITNDDCIGATPVLIGAPFITGDNTLATPDSAPDCGPATDGLSAGTGPAQIDGGRWYKVTGTGNVLTANTCDPAQFSFYSNIINIYCGGCTLQFCVGDSAIAPVGCLGPYATIDWCSRPGEEYLILVHGLDMAGAPETFSLEVTEGVIPTPCANPGSCGLPGDVCGDGAFVLTIDPLTGEGSIAIDTSFAASTIPLTVADCGGGGSNPGRENWVEYTATSSGNARIDTCVSTFDTMLAVFVFPVGFECELTAANLVACNDDANSVGGSNTCTEPAPPENGFRSALEMTVTAGVTYHVAVGGWQSAIGQATFRVIENFLPIGACDVGGTCSPGVTVADCAALCGDFFVGATCAPGDIPLGRCCLGGICISVADESRQSCGTNGALARWTAGAITCIGLDCSEPCVGAVATNGAFNGANGVRPNAGFNVLGVIDDFTLDAPAVLTSLNLGMIFNVAGGIASGAVQYEITISSLGNNCNFPRISDLVSSTSVPVAGPVVLTGVVLTVGAPAFGGHHEIVDGSFPVPIFLPAGHYALMIRVLDDPLNMFWGTANAAASGSADNSAIFGTDTTAPPPVDVNTPDDQRDHAFCIN